MPRAAAGSIARPAAGSIGVNSLGLVVLSVGLEVGAALFAPVELDHADLLMANGIDELDELGLQGLVKGPAEDDWLD